MRTRQLCVFFVTLASLLSLAALPARADVLTLDQCIDIALRQNSSVLTPGLKVGLNQAEQGVWTAWGGLLPSLDWSVDYLHSRGKYFDPRLGKTVASRYSKYATSLGLRATLFDGLGNIFTVRKAYQDRSSAMESYRSAELSLILEVKSKYFTLLKNQKLVEVRDDAVKRAEEQLKVVQSRFDLGSASVSEVLKAKVQFGTERLALLNTENNVKVAIADLNRLLNRDIGTTVEVSPNLPERDTSITADHAEEYALAHQPRYLAAREDYRSSLSDVRVARAVWYPSISGGLSRSYNTTRKADWLAFRDDDGTWSMFVSLSYPIFNKFFQKTTNATANVRARAAKGGLEQTKNDVQFAVREAHLAFELAKQTTRLAAETEASAQEDFNLAQEKYNLGAAAVLDLLNAQESLTRAKTDRVNADFDFALAVARLENAMGRGR